MENGSILTYLLITPILGSLILLFIRKEQENLIQWFGLAVSLAAFIISLVMFTNFDQSNGSFQLVEKYLWIDGLNVSYHIGVDGISVLLILLTTFLTPLTLISTWGTIKKNIKLFTFFMLFLEAGMLGVFISLDLFLFYIFWEAMLIPMYFIIGVWGGENRIYASIKFFIYTMFGSLLMLVAIIWLAVDASSQLGYFTTNLLELYKVGPTIARDIQNYLFLAFFFSFAIKVPLFPLHTWLPDAHVQAPTAGSVILAGVLLKMGGYGFIRFSVGMLPEATELFIPFIMTLSIIAVIYTSLVALAQTDIKKLIAYSSVAHMGIVTIGIFLVNQQGLEGAMMQMISHGLVSAALFLCVGVIYDRMHTREIEFYGGLVQRMPLYATVFMIFMLGSVGLPGTSGFVGEFLVIVGAFKVSSYVVIGAAFGIILSAVYMLYLYKRIIFGTITNDKLVDILDINLREKIILIPLAISVIILGIFPNLFLDPMRLSLEVVISNYEVANAK